MTCKGVSEKMRSHRQRHSTFFPLQYLTLAPNEKVVGFLLLNFALFGGQTILFSYSSPVKLPLIAGSFILAILFSFPALALLRGVAVISRLLGRYCNRIQASFLLFFGIVLGYILLTSLSISMPMGWILEHHGFSREAVNSYSMQTSNCALTLAILTWLRQLSILWKNDRAFLSF